MVRERSQHSGNLKDDEYRPMKAARIFKSDVGSCANGRARRLIPKLVPMAGYQMIADEQATRRSGLEGGIIPCPEEQGMSGQLKVIFQADTPVTAGLGFAVKAFAIGNWCAGNVLV